jgi:hypothetical protein
VRVRLGLALFLIPTALLGQSSNGVLSGSVVARSDGHPVRALVVYRNVNTGSTSYVLSNAQGHYSFPALLPGQYTVRVDAPTQGFLPQEQNGIELTVGGQVEANFSLAAKAGPSSTAVPVAAPTVPTTNATKGFIATVYGQDAEVPAATLIAIPAALTEALVGSLSYVIDAGKITELPYSARDVYTLLVMQPGVTSDSATGRGLGLAVNGQRVAGTNFLLDGVDNNDLLLTGPSARVSADAVEEYRMTTNNFSAEFGRATAFIANVVTRPGSNTLHGTAYEYFNHDRLNANSFSDNFYGAARTPFRLNQTGATAGGPIRRDRIFFFGSFERYYTSSQSFDQPSNVPGYTTPVYVPSASFVASLGANTLAKQVLTEFTPPNGTPYPGFPQIVALTIHYPLLQRNTLFSGRIDDNAANGKDRFSVRYAFSQNTADDFVDYVYPGLNAPLSVNSQNVVVNYTRSMLGGVNELKFGWNHGRVGFDRPHPEVPTLQVNGINLPGSSAAYGYLNANNSGEVVDNFSVLRGNHSLVIGFDGRINYTQSEVSTARDGAISFDSLQAFAQDAPTEIDITVDRFTGRPLTNSDYARTYRQTEWAAFVQDNWKIARRLTVNLGLRYEYFGVPGRTDGPADWNLFYGPGKNRTERLATATLQQKAPYSPDYNNFAPRIGFAWDPKGHGKTVLRGGYGISYDRIFNQIWQDLRDNSLAYISEFCDFPGVCPFRYKFPAASGLPATNSTLGPYVTFQVDQNLRTPYAQSWFLGVQHQVTRSLVVEVNHAGSLGRKLLALDDINRAYSNGPDDGARINPNFNEISYRGNQGSSDYVSLQASARQRLNHGVTFQVAYTLSRTRDNQSDPFRNPQTVNANVPAFQRLGNPELLGINTTSFTQQFNSSLDYGYSDFDQRHNIVASATAVSGTRGPVKLLTRDWQLSVLTGFRSGFPFSVLSSGDAIFSNNGLVLYNRADYAASSHDAFLAASKPGPAGRYLLNPNTFQDPAFGTIGNTPRNAFHGPGFWNADVGVSRSFRVSRLGETTRFQFRADFFNLFNHANLSNPDGSITSSTFGLATFGRQGFSGSLPIVAPIAEQARRIQFAVRLLF